MPMLYGPAAGIVPSADGAYADPDLAKAPPIDMDARRAGEGPAAASPPPPATATTSTDVI